jgi:dGTPase
MKSEKIHNLHVPEKFKKRFNEEEFSTSPYRDDFDRDRDRILYSRAFRRLKGKTQVFQAIGEDHLRTRLTHTLEVSQIARTISKNLKLNETLTEAIALGHDLGHTPFGHVGERTLNQIMNNCVKLGDFQDDMNQNQKGFKHNWQSLRVVYDLERNYDLVGLNLTNFTLWGIVNHSKLVWDECPDSINNSSNDCFVDRNIKTCVQNKPGNTSVDFYRNRYYKYLLNNQDVESWSFEAFIVEKCDEIAQRHHDLEDSIHMNILSQKEIVDKLDETFRDFNSGHYQNNRINFALFQKLRNTKDTQEFLSYLSKYIVNLYTSLLIESSRKNFDKLIKDHKLTTQKDFINQYSRMDIKLVKDIINYPMEFRDKDGEIRKFLKNRILNSYEAQRMDGKGNYIIRKLFKAYLSNPKQLHNNTILSAFRNYEYFEHVNEKEDKKNIGEMRNKIDSPELRANSKFQISLLRTICDNISGMTDDFAIQEFKQLYG